MTGVISGLLMPPLIAIALIIIWKPFEILVVSPILARCHLDFGFETLKNSVLDIMVDIGGVALGYYAVAHYIVPSFHLF